MLMDNIWLLDAIVFVSVILGGALGARLARAPAWKGGVIALAATAIQLGLGSLFGIESGILLALIFLFSVGLVGGRFGLQLSARQMAPVVIGCFLIPVAVSMGLFYLARIV